MPGGINNQLNPDIYFLFFLLYNLECYQFPLSLNVAIINCLLINLISNLGIFLFLFF